MKKKPKSSSFLKKIKIYFFLSIILFPFINYFYQIARSPVQIFSYWNQKLSKSSNQIWKEYGPSFEDSSTSVIDPHLLAAITEVESSGSPIATPKWSFRFSLNPFKIYTPDSSSVGLMQIVNGTFEESLNYCRNQTEIFKRSSKIQCWWNVFYFRIVPSHSIELTARRLHYLTTHLSTKYNVDINNSKKIELISVLHLCGFRKAEYFIKSKFNMKAIGSCGQHSPSQYVLKIKNSKQKFEKIAAFQIKS